MIGTKKHSSTTGKLNGYKFIKTANFEGGVTIFIKKRLFGFLWWIFVKDLHGNPITFNKIAQAKALMSGIIKYDHVIDIEYTLPDGSYVSEGIIYPMTDERAANRICKNIHNSTGETVPFDCAKAAWILDGRQYVHRAVDYAKLWNTIYKFNGKKLWTPLLSH